MNVTLRFLIISVIVINAIGIPLITVQVVAADSKRWHDDKIYVIIKSDKDVSPDKIKLVKDNLLKDKYGDPGRLRIAGQVYYDNWNAVFRYHGIETRLVYHDVHDNPDITIKLTNDINTKILGETQSINYFGVMRGSEITIYNTNGLDTPKFMAVVRHELGHGIGLGHLNCECIMNKDGIVTPWITNEDVDLFIKHYLR